ncbi:hypothetical protein [Flavobacterium praedii]|uniref:hypothetical protein n=1 Tax=Flavobacterium praedii TaxID=3002900 RepID=UPI0024819F7E|nr:hypothetical protein [Flavobacterium praedii]
MKYITKTYDLLLIGISFFVFLVSIVTDTIDYYFYNKFYEGFSMVISTTIFAFINLLILIIFTLRKDYKSLRVLGLINLFVFITGFLGFKIPLIILPLILSYGIYYIVKEIKDRVKEEQKSKIIETEN